jgi:four helix bundle protein
MGARHVRDLAAFRLCEEVMIRLEAETAAGRVAADRRFCDQLNDPALDAVSDVAEGFVRYDPRDFARFLDFAWSSLDEVRVRVEAGYRKGYFAAAVASDLLHGVAKAQRAVRSLRAYLWTVKKSDLTPRPCERARPCRLAAPRDRPAETIVKARRPAGQGRRTTRELRHRLSRTNP